MAFARIVETLVEKFGWPGLLVVFTMYMIVFKATDDQRHALIDIYLLGRGIQSAYPIILMGFLCLAVLFAQRYYYRNKVELMEAELDRVGTAKSAQQEQALGTRLHHAPGIAEKKG